VFEGLSSIRVLVLIKYFLIDSVPNNVVEELIQATDIHGDDEILEFISLVGEIHAGEYPDWFIDHCFTYVIRKIDDIRQKLPQAFNDYFDSNY
jgi:hypothetical protein